MKEIQLLLKAQLEWYKEYKDDEDYLYDGSWEQLNNLGRGDAYKLLKVLYENL